MSTFESTEQLHSILGGFFIELSSNPLVGPKLLQSGLKLRFNYDQPEGTIAIDLTGNAARILPGDKDLVADVEMSMKADTAHRFWLGKVILPIALARREIVAKGPIPKILKLLPIIKPAYSIYPEYLKKNNINV